jgi:hypothetical protein
MTRGQFLYMLNFSFLNSRIWNKIRIFQHIFTKFSGIAELLGLQTTHFRNPELLLFAFEFHRLKNRIHVLYFSQQ